MTYDINEEPIVLSKPTVDRLLRDGKKPRPHAGDLLALYVFYYYTAKWQGGTNARATTSYTARALGWGEDRVRARKGDLKKLGLVEDRPRKDPAGRITGHYIHVRFMQGATLVKNQTVARTRPGKSVREIPGTVRGNTGEDRETPETPLTCLSVPDELEAFSRDFLKKQHELHPSLVRSVTKASVTAGVDALRKLIRIDKWDFNRDIRPAVLWAQQDSFWSKNLLSLGSLRVRSSSNGEHKFTNIHRQWQRDRERQREAQVSNRPSPGPSDPAVQVIGKAWASLTGMKLTGQAWKVLEGAVRLIREYHSKLPGTEHGSISRRKVRYYYPTAHALAEEYAGWIAALSSEHYSKLNAGSLAPGGKLWDQYLVHAQKVTGMNFETGDRL